jgi:two-component system chemotaxis response regulator CheB
MQQLIEVICIGASTGGTEALASLLSGIGRPDLPPVVVVQHMGHSFLPNFANTLAKQSQLKLGIISGGAPLQTGHLYVPVGDYHLGIRRLRHELVTFTLHGGPLQSQRPSVDYTFKSIADTRAFAVGILLTGMGKDGAQGLLDLHSTGAITMAQDEASAVVFGMPREAIRLGAARYVGSIRDLRRYLDSCLLASQRKVDQKKASL